MKTKHLKVLISILVLLILVGIAATAQNIVGLLSGEDDNGQADIPNTPLNVYVLDVGQADSIFIELPNGENMLIDAGNNNDGKKICNWLEDTKDVEKITYLIGTHPHEDHIGGLDDVINRFDIGSIYMPLVSDEDTPTTKTYEDVLDAIIENDLSVNRAAAGEGIYSDGNLSLEFIAPIKEDYEGELNNYSAVLRLTYFDSVMLFMGDAEAEVEEEILQNEAVIDADIIKIGHHGSSSSTSKMFLSKVSPSAAIISCGPDNKYGHPTEKTLSKLEAAKIDLYRTDISGTIIIKFDKDGYYIDTDETICLDGGR